ncbi:MAG: CHAP domain-containing protein [Solirubrobacteraceae bacterium]|nr:CHAP domain-containing protein [Solirubrobacteraceae bacterium]
MRRVCVVRVTGAEAGRMSLTHEVINVFHRPKALAAVLTTVGAGLLAAPGAHAVPICGDGEPCPPPAAPQQPAATGKVDVADGYKLIVRGAPRQSAREVRKLKDGATVHIVCQTMGEQVTGTYGTSTLWNKLAKGGFVSDTYIYTGSDGRVAPECPRGSKPKPKPRPADKGKGRPRSVVLSNDYPYPNANPDEADPWGFYFRECTSFVAYRLNRLKKFTFANRMDGGHFGDAGHWDDNASALGFRVNTNPTVGSVMVRDSGTWGHVAIVAKVTKQRFLVEEFNHGVSHGYGQRWITRADSPEWDHFIHFRT